MRIRELRLLRYGKFTDCTVALPAHARDIHLIVGPNEAGKSTLRKALGDWLFGIPVQTGHGFLHPMQELRLGGVLERIATPTEPGARLDFERAKKSKNTLRSATDEALPDTLLQPWLGGLTTTTFQQMYALDHETLIKGSEGLLKASGDLGRLLFQSAAGIEGLGEALKRLEADADALWGPRRAESRAYYQAVTDLELATAALKQSLVHAGDWQKIHEAMEEAHTRWIDAQARRASLGRDIHRLHRILRVGPTLRALDAAQTKLTSLLAAGAAPLLPVNAATTVEDARRHRSLVANTLATFKADKQSAQIGLAGLEIDHTLLALADAIAALDERRVRFSSHAGDLLKRHNEISAELQVALGHAATLGWSCPGEDALAQRLAPAPLRQRLAILLAARDELARQREAAQLSRDQCRRLIDDARAALARLAEGTAAPGLAIAVDEAQRLGDLDAQIDTLEQRHADAARSLESGLAGLGAWRLDPLALEALHAPEPEVVEARFGAWRTAQADLKSQQDAQAAKAHEVALLQLELEQLVRNFQLVSAGEVAAARRARDEAWLVLKQSPSLLQAQGGSFELQVATADQLADTRFAQTEHAATRRAKADHLEIRRHEARALEEDVRRAHSRVAEDQAAWTAIMAGCGLPGLPLPLASGWLKQRTKVLEQATAVATLVHERVLKQQAADQHRGRLWGLLDSAASPIDTPAFSTCLQAARARLAAAAEVEGQRKALEHQIEDAGRDLPALQEATDAAGAAFERWTVEWQAVVTVAGYPTDVAPGQVKAELPTQERIDRQLEKIRGIRTERIDTMQADLDGFGQAAEALSSQVATDLVGRPAADIALALRERLATNRQAASETARLVGTLADLDSRIEANQRTARQVEEQVTKLMQDAAVGDLDALDRVIARDSERRSFEQGIKAHEATLAIDTDGVAIGQLRLEVANLDADDLVAEIARLEALQDVEVNEISVAHGDHATRQRELEAIGGSDAAARAEARRQEAMATMADVAERYLKLRTAVRLLKWSMEKFRETRQGPMLGKASSLFNALTQGSFNRLVVDTASATPRLIGIRASHERVEVDGMSDGTRDQLYLALRLSALELQAEGGLDMPLVADDLFINFDDQRTRAGLRVLGELSGRMQVICLTHHEHLVALAREVLGADLNVVRL